MGTIFKGTIGKWISRYNGRYMEVNREEDFKDDKRLSISVMVFNCIDGLYSIDGSVEAEANAKLIAAAPEMLDALLYFRDCVESWSDAHNDVREKVEKAINKALNETDSKTNSF